MAGRRTYDAMIQEFTDRIQQCQEAIATIQEMRARKFPLAPEFVPQPPKSGRREIKRQPKSPQSARQQIKRPPERNRVVHPDGLVGLVQEQLQLFLVPMSTTRITQNLLDNGWRTESKNTKGVVGMALYRLEKAGIATRSSEGWRLTTPRSKGSMDKQARKHRRREAASKKTA